MAAVIAMVMWTEPEPRYQGKKLSEWLTAWNVARTGQKARPGDQAKACGAVRHIGTKGLPWLVRWVAYETPKWKESPPRVFWKLPVRVCRWFYRRDTLRRDALSGFEILGTAAAPAVPELARLASGRNSDYAMRALSYIGEAGLPALRSVLENGREPARTQAAGYIAKLCRDGVDISSAVPALLLLDGENERENERLRAAVPFRWGAWAKDYWMVVSFLEHPELLPSVLSNALQHPDPRVRREAIRTPLRIGEVGFARGLAFALEDRSLEVRAEATNTFLKLAPEVLGMGGTNQAR